MPTYIFSPVFWKPYQPQQSKQRAIASLVGVVLAAAFYVYVFSLSGPVMLFFVPVLFRTIWHSARRIVRSDDLTPLEQKVDRWLEVGLTIYGMLVLIGVVAVRTAGRPITTTQIAIAVGAGLLCIYGLYTVIRRAAGPPIPEHAMTPDGNRMSLTQCHVCGFDLTAHLQEGRAECPECRTTYVRYADELTPWWAIGAILAFAAVCGGVAIVGIQSGSPWMAALLGPLSLLFIGIATPLISRQLARREFAPPTRRTFVLATLTSVGLVGFCSVAFYLLVR